jgi:hypothetical protein
MAVIQIDDDWKRQAQEEKQRLAEQAAERAASTERDAAARVESPRSDAPRGRDLPPANLEGLISTILTQAYYYLGEMGEEQLPVDLDMARYQIDLLGVIEEKTRGNLTPDEQQALDTGLYDLRSRYVSVATQMIR